jgi:signal transduction histidine kinase/ActR/RegA family two-component response regulator/HAMP domain-containing protein
MRWFDQLPIRRKLTWVILSICGLSLGLAGTGIALYEIRDYRRTLLVDTTLLADVVAANVGAALAFDDDRGARTSLEALRIDPYVVVAALYRQDGALFSTFIREGKLKGPIPDRALPAGAEFTSDRLIVTRPVMVNDRMLGSIYLRRELSDVTQRMLVFSGIVAITLVAALLVAAALSSRLQGPITNPILKLAETARDISERKDFSVRAAGDSSGEVGQLTRAFNAMLDTIESGRAALLAANGQLRKEVEERQVAERRANAQAARLAQLNQITRAVAERQDVESVFQTAAGSVEEQLAVDFACVCNYDEPREVLKVSTVARGSLALAEQMEMVPPFALAIEANGLARCLKGELLYEPKVLSVPMPLARRLGAAGLRAMVVVPLLVESHVFGVLLVARRAEASFTSSDCEFLQQLGDNVALAAHQSHLYSALQRAYDDLRQTQQAVMQQERLRALGQMASGIAHDINNAISPISLYIESMLEREPNLTPQSRERLVIVQRAIDDVAQTVARMREFYRQRPQAISLVRVGLNQLAAQVIELTKARWLDMPQQRGVVIDIRTDFAADLPPIKGIEGEIREALTNLVFNAVDAMPNGGTIRVRTFVTPAGNGQGEPRVVVEVADAGAGMNAEVRRRCLEPFFTTKGERGSGMGLAMVYGTVKRHQGEIEIDSVEGRGTSVQLLFPLAVGPDPFVDLLRPAPQNRLKVLVVDDDPLLLKSVSEILDSDGHQIVTASGGQEGINTFTDAIDQAEAFDAVITDLGMPYVDGRRVAAAVKAASSLTPVFMLTGWGHRLAAEGDVPAEVDRVLNKPPKLRELREVLATVKPRSAP